LIWKLLREPLLHFVVLGAALFGIYGVWGNGEKQAERIVVSELQVANLAEGFARTWRRTPTADELQGLIEEHIKDEVYYREGKAARLDLDDVIIKRRIRQKLEFIASEVAAPEPTEDQLASYLAAKPDRFKTGGNVSFRHVFFSDSRSPAITPGDFASIRAKLDRYADENWAAMGEPFLLGGEFKSVPQGDVERSFGAEFATEVFRAQAGSWIGPVPSAYGAHIVFVMERKQGSVPPLGTVRSAVEREWMADKRAENEQNFYRSLRNRYEILVEPVNRKPAG